MALTTDQLVNILSQTPPPRRPFGFLIFMMGITFAALCLTLAVLGLRHDLRDPLAWVTMAQKTILLAGVFFVSFLALRRAAGPVLTPVPTVQKALLPVLFAIILVCDYAFIPAAAMDTGFLIQRFFFCFIAVSTYGVLGMMALWKIMQHYAPADTKRAGMIMGLASAAAAALGYSVHCPVDHPLFILVAYGLPCACLAYLGWVVIPRFMRW